MKVAFLGLGVMGYPMAGHLAKAGHEVTVYNRTMAKADQWATDFGGHVATTPKDAAVGQEIVFACVIFLFGLFVGFCGVFCFFGVFFFFC